MANKFWAVIPVFLLSSCSSETDAEWLTQEDLEGLSDYYVVVLEPLRNQNSAEREAYDIASLTNAKYFLSKINVLGTSETGFEPVIVLSNERAAERLCSSSISKNFNTNEPEVTPENICQKETVAEYLDRRRLPDAFFRLVETIHSPFLGETEQSTEAVAQDQSAQVIASIPETAQSSIRDDSQASLSERKASLDAMEDAAREQIRELFGCDVLTNLVEENAREMDFAMAFDAMPNEVYSNLETCANDGHDGKAAYLVGVSRAIGIPRAKSSVAAMEKYIEATQYGYLDAGIFAMLSLEPAKNLDEIEQQKALLSALIGHSDLIDDLKNVVIEMRESLIKQETALRNIADLNQRMEIEETNRLMLQRMLDEARRLSPNH
jgi:hypothetical protein